MKKRLEELINLTHKHGVAIATKIRELLNWEHGLEALNRKRRHELEAFHKQGFTMYDTTDVNTVPPNPEAVAGYIDGKWPTYAGLVSRFPHAKHLSITVFGADAMCLDVEPGNPIQPAEVPAWVRRQHARGLARPIIYSSLDEMPEIQAALGGDSITRDQYKLWAAHYTYSPHIESGMDATQWTDKALGRNLDASSCHSWFL